MTDFARLTLDGPALTDRERERLLALFGVAARRVSTPHVAANLRSMLVERRPRGGEATRGRRPWVTSFTRVACGPEASGAGAPRAPPRRATTWIWR